MLLLNSTNPQTGDIVPFDVYHQQVAESLASQAAVVLNNRLLNERQASLMRMKRELEIGREIQRSFLPPEIPQPDRWEVEARFQPATEVAGDFYDVIELPHGHLGFVLADVVGKGVTASLFMAIIRTLYRALFQQYYIDVSAAPAAQEAYSRMTPSLLWIGRRS
ncbi:MAG: SpoIIE family protein phosphatase [Chloroflexota bacterium]